MVSASPGKKRFLLHFFFLTSAPTYTHEGISELGQNIYCHFWRKCSSGFLWTRLFLSIFSKYCCRQCMWLSSAENVFSFLTFTCRFKSPCGVRLFPVSSCQSTGFHPGYTHTLLLTSFQYCSLGKSNLDRGSVDDGFVSFESPSVFYTAHKTYFSSFFSAYHEP